MLIETIRINNGKPENLWRHEERAYQSAKMLFNNVTRFSFAEAIAPPAHLQQGICKCRITYSNRILNVEYEAYIPKKLKNLTMIHASMISYDLKFADRRAIENLKNATSADDVLMLKNYLLSDLSYANIALLQGNQWYTPAQPLLRGIRRQQLIEEGILIEKNIYYASIILFSAIKPINAMLDFHETPPLYFMRNVQFEHTIHLSEEKP